MEDQITSRQIGYIHHLVKNLGWDDAKYKTFLFSDFGVKTSKDLTKNEASRLIDKLQYELRKREGIFEDTYEILPDFGTEF